LNGSGVEEKKKFDSNFRGKNLRRRLGLSLKSDSSHQGIFVFKTDSVKGVDTDLKMGDTVIGVNGGKCRNMDEFVSLLGYGEDEIVDLQILRNGKFSSARLKFD
jgi:C-terminal processing protease CtpA/Prc